MKNKTHKSIVQRFFFEVLRDGKMEVLEEIMAPDCSYADGGIPKYTTRNDFEEYVREARKPYTHIEVTIHDLIAEDDRVAVRCTYHLDTELIRHTVPVMGIFRFLEDRIVEIWRNIAASEDAKS
jgi:limonene-1,2-epoxide hydrolase